MENALRRTVTIQPGGRIEITSSDLPSGREAEVIVLVREGPGKPRRTLASMMGAAKGLYSTPEEVVRYLREKRDTWD